MAKAKTPPATLKECLNYPDCHNETSNAYRCDECELQERAHDAFWEVVGAGHPEIHSGDVPPEFVFEVDRTMRKWISQWVGWNSSSED